MSFPPLTWLESTLADRLILTFAHFLWQGAAIGAFAWCFAIVCRRASSQKRYLGLVAALLLMAACPVATFFLVEPAARSTVQVPDRTHQARGQPVTVELQPKAPAVVGALDEAPAERSVSNVTLPPPPVLQDVAVVPNAQQAADANQTKPGWRWQAFVPYVVAAYLLGVLLLFGRLLLGLHGGWNLRRRSEEIVDPQMLDAIARRVQALGLRAAPAVRFCRDVAIPTVVGVFRPAVLLPVSLATRLTADQIDAVLTHELAHVRRFDHLANLVQRVIEALLFFHPAVWWVSHRVRVERENCCDDLVVRLGAGPLSYAESLLSVAEQSVKPARNDHHAVASVAATGRRSQLGRRIRRLIGAPAADSLRLSRGGIVALITAVALAGVTSIYFGGRVHVSAMKKKGSNAAATKKSNRDAENAKAAADDKSARKGAEKSEPVVGEWSPPRKLADGTGFRLRLRSSKQRWSAGETPQLSLDLWNDTRDGKLFYSGFQQTLSLVIDKKWYRWGDEVHLDAPVQVVLPGKKKLATVKVSLGRSWTELPNPLRIGKRLALTPGRHTVSVLMGSAAGKSAPAIGLASGTITIEVVADDNGKREKEENEAATAMGFGKVVERVLVFDVTKKEAYLDLETGEHVAYNPLEKKVNAEELLNKIDVSTLLGQSDTRVRYGRDMAAVAVDPNRWSATVDEVRKAVGKQKPQASVRLGPAKGTFFIKTRQGSIGILQIEPRAKTSLVTIRYKLVRDVDKANGARTETSAGFTARLQELRKDWEIAEWERKWKVEKPMELPVVWSANRKFAVVRGPDRAEINGKGTPTWSDNVALLRADGTLMWMRAIKINAPVVVSDSGLVALAVWKILAAPNVPPRDTPGPKDPLVIELIDARGRTYATMRIGRDGQKQAATAAWVFSGDNAFDGAFSKDDHFYFAQQSSADGKPKLFCLDRAGNVQWQTTPPFAGDRVVVNDRMGRVTLTREVVPLKNRFVSYDNNGKQVASGVLDVRSVHEEWGQAVNGVQAQLRLTKAKWKAGEIPKLLADVRNGGKTRYWLGAAQEVHEIEVDGQWHKWAGIIDVPTGAFRPGKTQHNVSFTLVRAWRAKPGEAANATKPLDLAAGKHVIRVAFLLNPITPGAKSIRVVSKPVEIEVNKQPPKKDGAQAGISVRGRVVSKEKRAGISVSLWHAGDGRTRTTKTDKTGRYSFDRVPASKHEYVLRVQGLDAGVWTEGVSILAADKDLQAGDLVLTRPQSVSGTVRDEQGKPVAGAEINFSTTDAKGNRAAVQTDAKGRYTLFVVPRTVGLYCNGTPERYEPTGPSREWKDRPATVNRGARVQNVDFRVKSASKLTGTIRGQDGKPVPNANLILEMNWSGWDGRQPLKPGTAFGGFSRSGIGTARRLKTNKDGTFTAYLRRPLPGDWQEKLTVRAIAWNPAGSEGGVARITTSTENKTTGPIKVALTKTAGFTVKLADVNGALVEGAAITMTNDRGSLIDVVKEPVQYLGNGRYRVTNLIPGVEYSLRAKKGKLDSGYGPRIKLKLKPGQRYDAGTITLWSSPPPSWGKPLDGLRCRWLPLTDPVRTGFKPVLQVEVENASDKPIDWRCVSETSWGVRRASSTGWSLPKFTVIASKGAERSQKHPSHFTLSPSGRLVLRCTFPETMKTAGRVTFETFLPRYDNTTSVDRPFEKNAVVCPPLTITVLPPTSEEEEAVDALRKLRARLEFDKGGRVTTADLQNLKITDDDLKPLAKLKSLQYVNLHSTAVTDAGLAHLAGLNELLIVSLWSTKVTDRGLVHLKKATKLRELNAGMSGVNGSGLAHLHCHKSLHWLNLGNGPSVNGRRSPLNDAGLAQVKRFTELRKLGLEATDLTDDGMQHLSGLTKLTNLSVARTKVTEDGLKPIQALKELETLDVTATTISDAGLKYLQALPKLNVLYYAGSRITKEGAKRSLKLSSVYEKREGRKIP